MNLTRMVSGEKSETGAGVFGGPADANAGTAEINKTTTANAITIFFIDY